jgi:hypothetical protein
MGLRNPPRPTLARQSCPHLRRHGRSLSQVQLHVTRCSAALPVGFSSGRGRHPAAALALGTDRLPWCNVSPRTKQRSARCFARQDSRDAAIPAIALSDHLRQQNKMSHTNIYVCFWPLADMAAARSYVRFQGQRGLEAGKGSTLTRSRLRPLATSGDFGFGRLVVKC